MKILLVSGGSGGHIAPLVAIARALTTVDANIELRFVCSDQPEDTIFLQKEGFTPYVIPRPRRGLRMPKQLWQGYWEMRRMLKEWKPDAVCSKGGAVSIPACYAAHRLHIPIVLHESDAVMGRANAFIARWATKVCVGFPQEALSDERLAMSGSKLTAHSSQLVTTGNPIRPEVTQGSRQKGLVLTGLTGSKPILLVTGGSQGAQVFNEFVRDHIHELLELCDIIHLTGRGKSTILRATTSKGYWQTEFAFEELPHLYACTTVALSRAGAGSISELASNRIPMILVPIEGLAHDHQVKNARRVEETGGGIIIRQQEFPTQMLRTLGSLLSDEGRYKTMQQKLVTFQSAEAARHIAEIIVDCIDLERRSN